MQARNTGFSDPIRCTQSQEESPEERRESQMGCSLMHRHACCLAVSARTQTHSLTHSRTHILFRAQKAYCSIFVVFSCCTFLWVSLIFSKKGPSSTLLPHVTALSVTPIFVKIRPSVQPLRFKFGKSLGLSSNRTEQSTCYKEGRLFLSRLFPEAFGC